MSVSRPTPSMPSAPPIPPRRRSATPLTDRTRLRNGSVDDRVDHVRIASRNENVQAALTTRCKRQRCRVVEEVGAKAVDDADPWAAGGRDEGGGHVVTIGPHRLDVYVDDRADPPIVSGSRAPAHAPRPRFRRHHLRRPGFRPRSTPPNLAPGRHRPLHPRYSARIAAAPAAIERSKASSPTVALLW